MTDSVPQLRDVKDECFPYQENEEAQLRFLLSYATLAPSHYNIQPWNFSIVDGGINLYLDPARIANIVDPNSREVTISCGAAIDSIQVAARHFGFATEVKYADALEDGLIAQIILKQRIAPTSQDNLLFKAIKRRQTNRRWFDDSLVPEKITNRCLKQTQELAVQVTFFEDLQIRSQFASLTEIAVKQQFSQPWYRQELSSWLRPSFKKGTDGMPSFGFFSKHRPTPLAGSLLKFLNTGKQVALLNKQKIIDGSPTLCVISTENDNASAWLDSGRAMSSVLLTLATAGLSASFMNQAIQLPHLRPQVAGVFNSLASPQLVLRVGCAKNVAWTPRREVQDCLI